MPDRQTLAHARAADQAKNKAPSTQAGQREPAPTTPGRPKNSGSRQQRLPDQALQSGSPPLDEEATRRSDKAPKAPPSKPSN
jgi:hypothetical protein